LIKHRRFDKLHSSPQLFPTDRKNPPQTAIDKKTKSREFSQMPAFIQLLTNYLIKKYNFILAIHTDHPVKG
jgi:hypothetical protein